jgi:hypothetical protein
MKRHHTSGEEKRENKTTQEISEALVIKSFDV